MTSPSTPQARPSRHRVSAAERRNALIEAAVGEFAHGGLHGTPVGRIARRVGVAQPYVFTLFPKKRELFLAAVERTFEQITEKFTQAADRVDTGSASAEADVLPALGNAYIALLETDRDSLMLQHQAYAACDDPVIRERVRAGYARLVAHVQRLSGAEPEQIDVFFRYSMWLNAAAAMGVRDLSAKSEWLRAEQQDSYRIDPLGSKDVAGEPNDSNATTSRKESHHHGTDDGSAVSALRRTRGARDQDGRQTGI